MARSRGPEPTKSVGFRITASEEQRLDALCRPLGCNRSELLRRLLKTAIVQASVQVGPLGEEAEAGAHP
jgi:hypothetical protein